MNKKGFTLIEIIVSIVLVSIVMISLLGSLIQLRSTYTVIHENSDVIVYSSSITRVINNDLALNNGIRYVSCEATSGQECDMILGNDSNRKLQIIRKCSVSICGANGGSCTPNTEINCDEMNAADTQEGIKHTNIKTTLKYIDTTDASNSELLYIRTLESDRYENVVKSGTGNYFKTKSVTTKGYNFQNMSATVYEFSQDGTSDSLIDQYTTILIKLNNLENEDLSKYDITLYTAGRYDWSNLIGSRYRLQLNNDGAEIPGTTQIDEIFGVGYFTAGMSDVGSQIKKIDIPKKSTQAFLGYYYKQNGTSPEVQVVDAEGTIVTTSRFFRDDIERNLAQDINSSIIIAKWANCEGGYVIVDGVCKPKTFTVVLNKNGGNPDKGTNSYTVNYNTKVRDIQIPQRAGYEFKGYNKGSEQFHDKDGKGTIIFKYTMNLTGDESPIAQWTLCPAGTFSEEGDPTCNKCARHATSTAGSVGCDACQGGQTATTGASSCDPCDNAAHVATWQTATWTRNSVSNNCQIATCKTGYHLSDNKCVGNTYTVTYAKNGATSIGKTSDSCIVSNDEGNCTVTSTSITRANFTIDGWHTDANATATSTDLVAAGGTITLSSNQTYNAITHKEVTITFYRNGNTSQTPKNGSASTANSITQKCTIQNTATKCSVTSPTITMSGYDIVGYSEGADNRTKAWDVNTSADVTDSKSYYAQTKKDGTTYTITFYRNGNDSQKKKGASSASTADSVSDSCTTATGWNGTAPGSDCSVTSPTIAKSGYTIIGYSTAAATHTSSWAHNTAKSVSANGKYYAQSSKAVSVTFSIGTNVDAIGSTSGNCTLYNADTSCKVSLPTITASSGYDSAGWNTSSGVTTGTAAGSDYSVSAATELFANGKGKTYYITYDVNGGTGDIAKTEYVYGTASVTLTTSTPTFSGYSFAGWATGTNSVQLGYSSGGKYTNPPINGVTLYALWYRWTTGSYYLRTMNDAVSKASSGGTIKLFNDYTASESVTINKNLTIDLNGKTLTKSSSAISVSANKSVSFSSSTGTIQNTSGAINIFQVSGTMTVPANITITQKKGYSGVVINSGGKVTLSGGTIQNTSGCFDIAAIENKGTFEMDSGNVYAKGSDDTSCATPAGGTAGDNGVAVWHVASTGAVSTIKGGTIEAVKDNAFWIQSGGGTVNLEGGTIRGNGPLWFVISNRATVNVKGASVLQDNNKNSTVCVFPSGTLNISSGGVYRTKSSQYNGYNNVQSNAIWNRGGTTTITGGTVGAYSASVYGGTAVTTSAGGKVTLDGGTVVTHNNSTYAGRTIVIWPKAVDDELSPTTDLPAGIFEYKKGTITNDGTNSNGCQIVNGGTCTNCNGFNIKNN